jgi:hypothetical protein
VLAGSHLRLGRNQQAIGAKEQDEKPQRLRIKGP